MQSKKKILLLTKFLLLKKIFAVKKKVFAVKKNFFYLKNFFIRQKLGIIKRFWLNLIILKKFVIMAGILNHQIVDFTEKKTSKDLKKNFIGVFPSNYVTKFITFHKYFIGGFPSNYVTKFITFHSMLTKTGSLYVYNYKCRSQQQKWHSLVQFS